MTLSVPGSRIVGLTVGDDYHAGFQKSCQLLLQLLSQNLKRKKGLLEAADSKKQSQWLRILFRVVTTLFPYIKIRSFCTCDLEYSLQVPTPLLPFL